MLFTGTTLAPPYGYGGRFSIIPPNKRGPILAGNIVSIRSHASMHFVPPKLATAAVAAAIIFSVVAEAGADTFEIGSAAQKQQQQQESGNETLSNIPQTLSGECLSVSGQLEDCKKARIQRPKSRKAETCTVKCVNTCIRGGLGSPGEGPLNVRRPLVVFKQGFRSRQYCLVECSDICNLIGDGDDGP